MKTLSSLLFASALLFHEALIAQPAVDPVDTTDIGMIKEEGLQRSRVMEILQTIVDAHGQRLTGSPEFNRAAEWARRYLADLGLQNAHLEAWGPFGKGWSLKKYHSSVLSPHAFPLVSYPRAWSPGTNGLVKGEVMYFNPATDSALDTYRGRLKGKFLMIDENRVTQPGFKPRATRLSDTNLLELANADEARRTRRRLELTDEQKAEQKAAGLLDFKALELARKEGALALLTASRGDGGNIFVQSATVNVHPDSSRIRAHEAKAPAILPQVSVSAEQYNRLLRMLERGLSVTMEMNLEVAWTKADSSYNIIAEIPGTDLKDEVVMIGGHFDSWHSGTGTTDNAVGVAVSVEAMRILTALGLKPRRTIRIGLWSGEEQGLLGSNAYVKKHLGEKTSTDSGATIHLTPAGERFSVYFNHDNGTGKIRGVYMQGNEGVRPLFRSWLKPFASMGASTLSIKSTGSSDHESFNGIGLPGFQFIQDDVEYFTLTWHSTMDLFERAIPEDLMNNAVIMAAFAYNAAMRDELFPRKP